MKKQNEMRDMSQVTTIRHKGKEIIFIDLAHSTPEQSIVTIPQATHLISQMQSKSALVFTDVTDANYNKEVGEKIKELVSSNTPYIKASAIVGADGIRGVLLNTVIFITHREIKTFDRREDALDWLADHV